MHSRSMMCSVSWVPTLRAAIKKGERIFSLPFIYWRYLGKLPRKTHGFKPETPEQITLLCEIISSTFKSRFFMAVYQASQAKALLLLDNALYVVISLTVQTLYFLDQPLNLLSKSSNCMTFQSCKTLLSFWATPLSRMPCYGNLIPTVKESNFKLIQGREQSQKLWLASSTGTSPRGFRLVGDHETHTCWITR